MALVRLIMTHRVSYCSALRIRLFNQDIIDLYNRVPVGAHVMVVQG